jgi:hypothetical protein
MLSWPAQWRGAACAAALLLLLSIAGCGALPAATPAAVVNMAPSSVLPPTSPVATIAATVSATPVAPAAVTTAATAPRTVTPSAALAAELAAIVKQAMPPSNTTPGPGYMTIEAFPLVSPAGLPGGEYWLAYTAGMRSYQPDRKLSIAVYTHGPTGWQAVSRADLQCAEYLNSGDVKQVPLDPGSAWIVAASGVGAHGGCFELFSFDGATIRSQLQAFSPSPGMATVRDIFGDGANVVVLDQSEPYVFCYACGVRYPRFKVMTWDGTKLVEVPLATLPDSAPTDLKTLNDKAVALAQGGLWKDAQTMIGQAAARDPKDATVARNAGLIRLTAEAAAKGVNGGYPLLGNVFYGDYDAALNVMRPFKPEDIFSATTPLVVGTAAQDWRRSLSEWLLKATNLAITARPDLAAPYFLRGWGLYLTQPMAAGVLADVEKAAQLAPNDPLFAQSAAYLKGKQ